MMFSCNHEGHWARDCPRNAPEEHKPGSQNFGKRFQGASGPPSRNWGSPPRNWGPPSRNWGPPSRNWGPPPRNWGPPMVELEITKLGNKWGVRRWDHLQVLFQNGDRNRDFPHQVFPGMKRTKGS
ncbi:hypothetical protein JTB14_011507 [Gonioctena quinquepunctata]|nr:hypothetical protein JTB14_011507 [Gonioctena quinquepunctata]